jgi:uncharacterized spore protein YtfJ
MGAVERLLESVGGGATVRAVYGDPIVAEGRTVVPVARVRYAFGGGYGEGEGDGDAGAVDEAGGSGAGAGAGVGGALDATPLGFVELDATDARLVRFDDRPPVGAHLVGLVVGDLLGRRARR